GAISNSVNASAIIDNGTIQLGVDDFGQLNPEDILGDPSPVTGTSIVGLRYLPTGNESTSHGCLCEGFGIGIGDTGVSGFANNDDGVFNLTSISFDSTASTATSVAELSTGELRVSHIFTPSPETPDLYQVSVTIENISGADIADVRYTRTFDWDIEPSTFSELVTIGGVEEADAVLFSGNNGFDSSDPFAGRTLLAGLTEDTVSFEDEGPADHGANFDFGFGALMDGESLTFDIFYGASLTEAGAIAALAAVEAEVFSFGQVDFDPDGLGLDDSAGNPSNTFIFGFSGVGGDVVFPDPDPDPVPAPGAFGLIGLTLAGLSFARRRRV
ncbi:MAG: hypothetical protein AAGF15_10740, partial [Pseudomonadota bacterium]